ncbi:hypothetical protein Pst134EA_027712 [Puccinia striiformis f. sp. tritici]|uniref:Uncharacterized protein n=1 Tax=Puccinia striiformis f. sp. tritici PST-78 TaxID=1165861 RepID=A0A0L0UZE4_9BASI|nr:hypothetical protein Pst134EA_027712 [Puccinia striiformis f. sp. tritici]KAH9448400.1 hypothetical protein Pst134EA_027712 [Puccinia striiformis f. sp. tritici]KNE92119.1 hypothetical protein PSTG_14499 [Puccinia striiformis f. sp. tritici PST-78]
MHSETSNSTRALAQRARKIQSVAVLFHGLSQKFDLPPDGFESGEKDPNLTMEDMGDKAEILGKLQCNLLPLLKDQITSLLTSLDLQHNSEDERPNLDLGSTLKILSAFERTMMSTLSSIRILAHGSPLPDKKHDHRLHNLKSFRCARLYLYIDGIVKPTINTLLIFCSRFTQCCGVAIRLANPALGWEEPLQSMSSICGIAAAACGLIDETITLCRKSDFALIQEGWLTAEGGFNEQLEHLTELADLSRDLEAELAVLTILPSEEPDLIERTIIKTRRKAAEEEMVEVAKSTMSLVKLARILVKKLLRMIPKKPIFEQDIGINSNTLEQFYDLFAPVRDSLGSLVSHLREFRRTDQTTTIADRDQMDTLVYSLSDDMKCTMIFIASHLSLFQYRAKNISPKNDFKAWSGTLEKLWDKAVDRLLNLISSLEVEPEQ